MSHVSLRDVEISYGPVKVLDRLDLDVAEGEFFVLLGPSGCGKSTLLNAIAGLTDVAAGTISIGGRNVTWEEPRDRGIAMVFQSYALYPTMTVRGNMSFGLRVSGMAKAEVETRVAKAASLLRMTELLDRKPSQLSGGQRQRVAIGRALVRDASVFLFDEPLSNLDAQLRAELRVEIKHLHQRLGSTMIYVTHDQIEALTLANRIAVMRDRRIQQLGTPQDIYQRPASRFVATFVGSPAMSFLPGRIISGWFEGSGLRVDLTGYERAAPFAEGQAVELGIRPEHVSPDASGHDCTITMVEPMGADLLAWTRFDQAALSIRLPAESRIAVGDRLRLALPARHLSLFDLETGTRL